MAIRKYKPTTAGRRGASVADFAEVTRSTPEKSLLRPLTSKGGRNAQGRVVQHNPQAQRLLGESRLLGALILVRSAAKKGGAK